MQEGVAEILFLSALAVLLIVLSAFYFNYNKRPHRNESQDTELLQTNPTTIPDGTNNSVDKYKVEYKNLILLTTELTREQYNTFYERLGLKWGTTNSAGWKHTQAAQNHELFIKDDTVCVAQSYWCGALPTDFYDEEKQNCLEYDINLDNPKEWNTSNTAQCCHGLIKDKQYAFGCTLLENEHVASDEDYQMTLKLLKNNGVDCEIEECPIPFENKILYPEE